MFGSDWPVCTVAATYDRLIASTETLLASTSTDERASIFGGTAGRVYALFDRIDADLKEAT